MVKVGRERGWEPYQILWVLVLTVDPLVISLKIPTQTERDLERETDLESDTELWTNCGTQIKILSDFS